MDNSQQTDARLDELSKVVAGAKEASAKIDTTGAARTVDVNDVEYYIYLRSCELKGEEPLETYKEYIESLEG
jgi:uncharacterized protein YacL (UPF0231 family)